MVAHITAMIDARSAHHAFRNSINASDVPRSRWLRAS